VVRTGLRPLISAVKFANEISPTHGEAAP
jgi:hypothetical protein